ncbi:MAG: ribonuclease J [Fimbriimonadaceae bacterium]|nr:ribonuclease J [Fimbriimonadaceae bacterium]
MTELSITPLGGAGEIGKNCTVVQQGDEWIVVDCGLSFPHEEHYGVDIVVPDFDHLVQNREKVKGVFLTHAHEDHVGALGYLLSRLDCPIYATRLTSAMVRSKLAERANLTDPDIREVASGETVKLDKLSVEFVRVTHSIPESNALAVRTEHGIVLFTGDFRFDFTPVDGFQTDVGRLAKLADEGVVLLLSDSTNVERPGWGPSESTVTDGLRHAFRKAKGRVLTTMFASNIHRMQQIFDVAHETGRVVAVTGRRMEATIALCRTLGYLNVPPKTHVRLEELREYRPEEICVIATGSQGEPMAALTQMSRGEYSKLQIRPGDTVLYSARPIPGNEAGIWRTVNRLFNLGAVVLVDPDPPIHVSGHAYREELMAMINLTKPFYLAPVHGEARHQFLYCEMAEGMGHARHRMFTLANGDSLVISEKSADVARGSVPASDVLIDQNTNMAVDSKTIQERQALGHDGVAIASVSIDFKRREVVSRPRLEVRGLAVPESVVDRAQSDLCDALEDLSPAELGDKATVEKEMAEAVRVSIKKTSRQQPLVVAIAGEA